MGEGKITGASSQSVYAPKTQPTMVDQSTQTDFAPEVVALSPQKSKSELPDEVGEKAKETLEKAHSASETAEKSGIKLKKREFFKTLAVAIGSGVLLGAGFIATLATGGAATPLLLLAATNMTVAVGDAVCAYKDWHGTNKNLPMGSDSVGNVMYAVLKRAGVDSDKSLKIADRVSMFGRGIFALTTISSSQKLSHSVSNFATNVAKDFKLANKKQQTLATNFTSVRMSELSTDEDVKADLPSRTDDHRDSNTLGLERSKGDRKQRLTEIETMEKESKARYDKSSRAFDSMRLDWRSRYEESVTYDRQTDKVSFSNESNDELVEVNPTETEKKESISSVPEGKIESKPKQKSAEQSSLEGKLQHKQNVLKAVEKKEQKLIKTKGQQLLKADSLYKTVSVVSKKGVESYEHRVAEHGEIVSFLTSSQDSEFTEVKELEEQLQTEISHYEQSLKELEPGSKTLTELSGLGQYYRVLSTNG
ncbi:MAG: hypothetical protein HAW66_07625 [Shewanella sp.]|nr:hypothetical protein [Shewanella sp.]